MKTLIYLFILLWTGHWTLAQGDDILIIEEDTISISCLQITAEIDKISQIGSDYFEETGNFSTCCFIDCYRSYFATWTIKDSKLYLVKLRDCDSAIKLPVKEIYSSWNMDNGKIWAEWYSGVIIYGTGELIPSFGKEIISDEDLELLILDFVPSINVVLTVINGRVVNIERKRIGNG